MFDLEQSIADWRRQMLDAGIKSPEPLEELESHLREEIGQRLKSGAAEQLAFETAVERVGSAGALRTEFAKAEGATRKTIWLFLTVAALAGCWMQFGHSPATAVVYGIFLAGLIAASFIDFAQYNIPDQLTLGGVVAGITCSALWPQLHGQHFAFAGMSQSLIGIGAGAALTYSILRTGKLLFGRHRVALAGATRIVFTETAMDLPGQSIPYAELFYRRSDMIELRAQSVQIGNRSYKDVPVRVSRDGIKIGDDTFNAGLPPRIEAVGADLVLPREAMGMGDVKLMAAVGAFMGWQGAIFSLMASSLIGSFAGAGMMAAHRSEWASRLPYGPCVALAAAIWIFGGSRLFEAMFGH